MRVLPSQILMLAGQSLACMKGNVYRVAATTVANVLKDTLALAVNVSQLISLSASNMEFSFLRSLSISLKKKILVTVLCFNLHRDSPNLRLELNK